MASVQQFSESTSPKFQGDGFVIEDCIIKGEEKVYPCDYNNIGELILETLNKTPEHIAHIDAITGIKITYKHLKERSFRLALWMKKEAIGAGDIVSLCSPNHLDINTIYFAIFFVGAAYNVLPYDINLELARYYINYIKPRVIFTYENKANVLKEAAELENHAWKIIVLDGDDRASFTDILMKQSTDEVLNFQIAFEINPEQISLIVPTSGTTGMQKYINYSYETCMRWLSADASIKNINRIRLSYNFPEWLVHFRYLLKYFLDGSTQIFRRDFDPHEACRIIEKYKVDTIVFSTYEASLLAHVVVLNKYNVQSVSLIHPLGTRLFANIEQKLRNIFPNAVIGKKLGSSETQCLVSSVKKCFKADSEGTVLPNVQLKIVDVETGLKLGQNKAGEICAKTPYIMTSYYKDPAATKLSFDNEGWFHTGDKGYYDGNGEIFVVGRLKEVIRFRNKDYFIADLEQILLSHPDILDAAVVGIHHDLDVERPVAFIKINPRSKLTEQDILKLTRELPYSDTFRGSIIFADQIPRSTNGKINRRVLREQAVKVYASCQKDF